MVTGLYAGILLILMIVLAANVVRNRIRAKVSLGDGGDKQLLKAMRAHGNLIEYAPWLLLMMVVVEHGGASAASLHTMGVFLLSARLAHVYAILYTDFRFRRYGVLVTWIIGLILAVWSICTFLR